MRALALVLVAAQASGITEGRDVYLYLRVSSAPPPNPLRQYQCLVLAGKFRAGRVACTGVSGSSGLDYEAVVWMAPVVLTGVADAG